MAKEKVITYETVECEETRYYCDDCSAEVDSEDDLWPVVGNPGLDLDYTDVRDYHIQQIVTEFQRTTESYPGKRADVIRRIIECLDISVVGAADTEVCAGCYERMLGVEPAAVDVEAAVDGSDQAESEAEDETDDGWLFSEDWYTGYFTAMLLIALIGVLVISVSPMSPFIQPSAGGLMSAASVVGVVTAMLVEMHHRVKHGELDADTDTEEG